jgi:hypothetical protein
MEFVGYLMMKCQNCRGHLAHAKIDKVIAYTEMEKAEEEAISSSRRLGPGTNGSAVCTSI